MTTDKQPLPSPADLAKLKQNHEAGAPTPEIRVRRPGNALFEYAYMGYVRKTLADPAAKPDLYDQLAVMAEPEDWDGRSPEAVGSIRILRNYIRWTFERASRQEKLSASSSGTYSAFNTGLATPQQETIYGLFRRNSRSDSQQWAFVSWVEASKREFMDHFPPSLRPEFVTYTEDPADYVYDWRRELVVNVDHILNEETGNLERFPEALRNNPYLARMALKGAVDASVDRVRRNYKAAVPSWYPTHDTVQLLLPLSLQSVGVVDLALVVSRQGEFYRGHTVLTTAMAYTNARLLARPDSDWLQPASEEETG
ncbi:DUF3825 domain-containing protein [Streptomyces sp. NBC_00353]|uniref:DUF3825 domain-containing protein n=1 Tax=Streptomyces sp. NBC_00353 TaxID=2975722 RepID=UPI002E272F20